MKRFLSLLLAVLIGFAGISAAVPASAAAETADAVITVGTVEAKPGETVTVDLILQDNPCIVAMELMIEYDNNMATLTSVKNGEAFSYMTMTPSNQLTSPCKLVWDCVSVSADQAKAGVIATLTFQVSENVEDGTEIEIRLVPEFAFDNDIDMLNIGTVNGCIRVGSTEEPLTGSIRARSATLNLLDKVCIVYKCSDDIIATNN